MDKQKIGVGILALAIVVTGIVVERKHSEKADAVRIELANARAEAEKARTALAGYYTERLTLLEEIDRPTADQIRARIAGLKLETEEGLGQYDLLQGVVSERFSKWIASNGSKKSTLLPKLRAVEIQIEQKRKTFIDSAFAANEAQSKVSPKSSPIAVFKAEALLHEMRAKENAQKK